ncbi:MAG: LysR family transcriptional regulator [Pseudomonadales bacterium]|nr:LysR family transcriptional regulator [Pseudomonadales bacterium]
MKIPKISLDHWAAFTCVVNEGSFALAAEALNKSQSSISYAIARINEQLPQPVLRIEGRRAILTEDGKVLYRRASQLLRQAEETEETARMLARGLEAEITIAIDSLLEFNRLLPVLEEFARQFPMTRLRILETTLSGTEEALLERRAELVIAASVPTGFLGTPLSPIRMLPVARADHPLFDHADLPDFQGIADWELRAYRQVVLRDTGSRRTQDAGWLGSEQRWTVSHFSSSLKILEAGLAFGFMPEGWVRPLIKQERLRVLPLAKGAERILHLYLISAAIEAEGPATCALFTLLLDALSA